MTRFGLPSRLPRHRTRCDVVAPVHPKAMPVILTTEADREAWMTAPAEEALKLQRPLPDGVLEIVAAGEKEDAVADEAA